MQLLTGDNFGLVARYEFKLLDSCPDCSASSRF